MAPCLFRVFVLALITCLSISNLHAQPADPKQQDQAFFAKKLPEYRQWLRQNRLDGIFYADSVAVSNGRATLFLTSAYQGRNHVCDSMQSAWNKLEADNRMVNGQFFHERLLQKWAFLAEVHPDQAEVIVRCHSPAHFQVRVTSRSGKVPAEARTVRSTIMAEVETPDLAMLQQTNTGDNSSVLRNRQVRTVTTAARSWLVNYYKNKGTPILWKARIDSSYSTFDDFILEVTHMSDVICPDGYFEYHRIYVKGTQNGDDVVLSWEFQGKYGSGIIFPPRKNDYKDMELRYKNNLEDYQKRLFKQLLDYLRQ